jgi:regulatory protein
MITSLVAAGRNGDRVDVYVDGEWAVRINQSQLLDASLCTGLRLTAEQWSDLLDSTAEEEAYNRALNFLSYRPRSSQEVARSLASHRVDEHVAGRVLERLKNAGLVDDEQFADFWISNRRQFSPRGARALRQELYQRGVSRDVIERSIQDFPDEVEMAARAARRRARALGSLDGATFFKKLLSYLNRRGFDYETSKSAIDLVWAERQSAESP